jgi:hypothetical protein
MVVPIFNIITIKTIIMKYIKLFIIECLFFTKPFEGNPIPNWLIAIVAWINIYIITIGIQHILTS